MEILHSITSQMAAVGLPLYAVTLTAVPTPDTPLLLMLHWHGFRADERTPLAGHPRHRPVPGSAIQINAAWHRLEEVDLAMLDAAWQLGAWDMERLQRRACSSIGASAREALECRQAFGDNPFAAGDETHLLAEAPDRSDLMRLGAACGYVRWLFRPVRGGLWRDLAEDDTLTAEGGRYPPCPIRPNLTPAGRNRRMVYRLGRVARIVV